jgi:hypothetical protein
MPAAYKVIYNIYKRFFLLFLNLKSKKPIILHPPKVNRLDFFSYIYNRYISLFLN